MHKNIMLYICAAILLVTGSCTKNFDAINTDPTQANAAQFNPNLLFPSAQVEYFNSIQGYSGALLLQSMWVQILASASYPSYYSNGDKYVASSNLTSYQGSLWLHGFNSAGYAAETLRLTADKAGFENLRAVTTIMQMMAYQTVSDVYGDIPFSEASQGTEINQPVYDAQQAVYTAMLKRLDSVIPTLDASKTLAQYDIFYKGNVDKWKKFGYSLMLRMAMRLTKIDAATAKTYAEKAVAGGTFASMADDAFTAFDRPNGYNNNNSGAYQVAQDFSEVKWGKMLIDYLKTNGDPRLGVIAEVPQPGIKNAADEGLAGDRTPASQQGMPNGFDANGGATDIKNAPGYPGSSGSGADLNVTGNYSRPSIAVYLDLQTTAFALNYAETELLLAEAAARGWNVGASAAQHYANGLTAAIKSLATINASGGAIADGTVTAFVAAHPLDVSSPENSIAQINTQYWVTAGTLFDFVEAWSNWRRSGYPVLTPVNYTAGGTNFSPNAVPRRQAYPITEASNDPENYANAVGKLPKGDAFTERVWWDK